MKRLWFVLFLAPTMSCVAPARKPKNVNDTYENNSPSPKNPSNMSNVTQINEPPMPLSPPSFKNPSKLYNMDLRPAGSSFRMRCAATGNPTPNVTWYRNKETPIVRPFFPPVYGKWSLILDEVTKYDNADYTCVVCNPLGCINHTMKLAVQDRFPSKPFIKEGYPKNVTIVKYSNVTFNCPPISDLEPYVLWIGPLNMTLKEINTYDFADRNRHPGVQIASQNPYNKEEDLTLYNVTYENQGWYVCVAINSFGNTTEKAYLTIVDKLEPPSSENPENSKSITNVTIAIFGGILSIAAIVVLIMCRKLKKEKTERELALEMARDVIETYWKKVVVIEKPKINNLVDTDGAFVLPVIKIEKQMVSEVNKNAGGSNVVTEYELPLDEKWEVPRETVVLIRELGEGEFGKVMQAECVGAVKRGQSTVAVKLLKDDYTDVELWSLVSEMEVMKVVGKHTNIINLIGCCTQGGPLYVILEFARHGCLKRFLSNRRPGNGKEFLSADVKPNLTPQDLVSFAHQAAKGMEYLSSRHCIHRDLAARNILVSDNFVIKIADFGLAKNIENEDYYRKKTKGKLPVRWMAPESLNDMLFTVQTDVWSFGVLMWEIMTLGATPYKNVQGLYMYQHLRAGNRLEKPPCCDLNIYLLMRECWSFSPKERPNFTEIVKELDKILTKISDQKYLDLNPPESESSQGTTSRWVLKEFT